MDKTESRKKSGEKNTTVKTEPKKESSGNNRLLISRYLNNFCIIITILSFFGISASAVTYYISKNWKILIVIFVLIFILIIIWQCKKHRDAILSLLIKLTSVKTPYCFQERRSTYEYISNNEMKFTAEYIVKSMQTGVDHILSHYTWSGSPNKTDLNPKPILGNGFDTKSVEKTEPHLGRVQYKIFSRNHYNKNDQPGKLGVIINLKAENKLPDKHLTATIGVPTGLLKMTVILPSSLKPNRAWLYIYLHASDDFHWKKIELKPEIFGKKSAKKYIISRSIKRPFLGSKYAIVWE